VITDLGVLRPDPKSFELVLAGIYPGVSIAQVNDNTGWDLAISPDLAEIAPPSGDELTALRELLASVPAAAS
jgi:glutaconate CoA-transferase subunit B